MIFSYLDSLFERDGRIRFVKHGGGPLVCTTILWRGSLLVMIISSVLSNSMILAEWGEGRAAWALLLLSSWRARECWQKKQIFFHGFSHPFVEHLKPDCAHGPLQWTESFGLSGREEYWCWSGSVDTDETPCTCDPDFPEFLRQWSQLDSQCGLSLSHGLSLLEELQCSKEVLSHPLLCRIFLNNFTYCWLEEVLLPPLLLHDTVLVIELQWEEILSPIVSSPWPMPRCCRQWMDPFL